MIVPEEVPIAVGSGVLPTLSGLDGDPLGEPEVSGVQVTATHREGLAVPFGAVMVSSSSLFPRSTTLVP